MISGWYLIGLVLLVALAATLTATDCWLLALPRPLPRRGALVLAARWGFLATVLIYAWLIDSHRIPYAEPGIWVLFVAGITITVVGAALARTIGHGPRS